MTEQDPNNTTTLTAPAATAAPAAQAVQTGPVIDQDIRQRLATIEVELGSTILERADLIHGVLVGRVAQEHVLMLGPGGTGKSFLARSLVDHITGASLFETAFDETTDPSQVFGPPDIKAMVEDGKTRRVVKGMLPEATDGFLDEFFNGNGPLLHSVMPVLNERVFHNNGMPSSVPLRQCLMGTNKLNADADQAALWDRVHLRFLVDYLSQRAGIADMVGQAIDRMLANGRGTSTSLPGQSKTTVTLDELDQAHREALSLVVPSNVLDTFLDIKDELRGSAGVQISDRRAVEGMAAVMANAWLRNHTTVTIGDLDILASMWWTLQEQAPAARKVILELTNPGEKAALDLLDSLDDLKAQTNKVTKSDVDEKVKRRQGVEAVKTSDKILNEAAQVRVQIEATGGSTSRIDEVIVRTKAFKVEIGGNIFGIQAETMQNLANAAN